MGIDFEPSEWALTESIMGYWGNFLHTGSPNGDRLACLCQLNHSPCFSLIDIVPADWPPYGSAEDVWMQLATPHNKPIRDPSAAHCDFWDGTWTRLCIRCY